MDLKTFHQFKIILKKRISRIREYLASKKQVKILCKIFTLESNNIVCRIKSLFLLIKLNLLLEPTFLAFTMLIYNKPML